ncbi:MAG: hypothetical protein KJO85_03170 [Gammaproteobacteria bacterium]|nr:hypothetical protein [Gammaproteobacteria bacterium]
MIQQPAKLGLYLLYLALMAGLVAWLILPAAPAGFDWDDTWYLWMAEWYSGRSEHRDVAWMMMHTRQYPPLFPYLLSLSGEVLIGHAAGLVMNALFLAAAVTVALAWLLDRGMPMLGALAGSLVIAVNPVSLEFIPTLMSEPLFLLLTTGALALACRGSTGWRTWLAIGLLAGLSVATRSAGWALVAGLMISLLAGDGRARLKFFLPGLLLGLLVHFGLKSGLPAAHSYLEGFAENRGNINAAYLLDQLRAIWAGWSAVWGSVPFALAMGLLVLPGLALGLKRGRAEAWYVLVSILMLLAWPFPGQMGRFLWVLLPAALALVPVSVSLLPYPAVSKSAPTVVLVLALVLSIPGGLWRTVDRLGNPPGDGLDDLSRLADWTRPEDRQTALMNLRVRRALLDDADKISGLTGNMQCIYSELPALVSIRSKRISFASPWNSLEDFAPDSRACRYYYLVPGALPGADAQAVQQFSDHYQELFRSSAPWDETGELALGVFYRLDVKPEIAD